AARKVNAWTSYSLPRSVKPRACLLAVVRRPRNGECRTHSRSEWSCAGPAAAALPITVPHGIRDGGGNVGYSPTIMPLPLGGRAAGAGRRLQRLDRRRRAA